MQTILHYFLHFIFPLFLAYFLYPKQWKKVYLLLLATMLIDLDHLVASPIFVPNRCSINYHPLHSYYILPLYIFLLFLKKPYSIIGIGLVFHLFTDLIDCIFMYDTCAKCLEDAPALPLVKQIYLFIK